MLQFSNIVRKMTGFMDNLYVRGGFVRKNGRFTDNLCVLADEFYRFLDERVHVAVIIDEWDDLTVAGED